MIESHPRVTLLALTLNEVHGVRATLPCVDRQRFHQILVVDGGSTDGTVEWCRDNGFDVLIQCRSGIRFAYFEALPVITGDIIVTISPDGNCDPAMLAPLLAKMAEGYDMVIGSRYLGDARSDDDTVMTAFGNWLFTRTVNLLHHAQYTDCMVIYRAFRRTLIEELDLDKDASYALPERLFRTVISWEPLMSVRAAKRRLRVAEIAAGEPERIGGKSKLQPVRWGAAYYFQFWRELWYWR